MTIVMPIAQHRTVCHLPDQYREREWVRIEPASATGQKRGRRRSFCGRFRRWTSIKRGLSRVM
jgi:hypothetical protein